MLLSRRTNWWMGGLVLAVLLAYVVWPTISVFTTGLKPENVSRLLGPAGNSTREALFNSVWISVWTVLGAGTLGTLLAWLLHRFDFPLRRAVTSVAALPLALPPLVGVLAFLFLYGESGMLPRSLQAGLGLENVPFSFDGLWAVWLVHVYSMYVFFYLFGAAALKTLDRSQMEAAEDLGAGPLRAFRSVVLPHLRPALTGASLLVFMISMASFTAPLLFAGTERFLTLQIYNYKMNGDLEMSAAVSVLLTVICLLFLAGLELDRRRKSEATGKGTPAPPRPVTSGWARAAAVATASGVLLFLLLPVLTIVLVSFVKEGSWTYQILPTAYTLENYTGLFANPDVFAPIGNSLRMATLASIANVVFGVTAALFIVKGTVPGRSLVRILAVLPFAIPGTVIAINLIVTFDTPGPLSAGQALTGTVWLLPLAYFIRHIPLVVRSTTAALESYDDRLTDASMDLGAGTIMTLRRVVFPVVTPGIVAGTLLTFVTALGEFVSSILLYVFDNRPISVEILSQLRIYDFGAAAAYSVFLMVLIGGATMITSRAR